MKLSVEPLAPMVTVRREVQSQPVLAADDGGGEVHAGQPGGEKEEQTLL